MVWATISWYSVGPIITLHGRNTVRECEDRLGNQVHHMIQTLFPNNDAVFQEDNAPPFTQLERFSHGSKSIQVKFNIFPGQHNHQIWISLNHSGRYLRLGLGKDSKVQHLQSNLIFKMNGINFLYRLLKTCTNPFQEGLQPHWRQKVDHHHINKEMCTVHEVVP
jgi:hypothetical protein